MVGAAGCRSEEPCNHTCVVQRVQHLHWALQAAERNQRDDLDGLLGQLLPILIWSRRHSWRSQVWPGEMLLAAFPTTWLLMRLLPCLTRLAGAALWARFQAPTIARLRRASKNKATARQRIRAMQRRAAWLAFLLDPSRLLQAHAWCSLLWGPLFTWRPMLSSAAAKASGSKKYSWMMTSQSCSWRAAIHWMHGGQALPGRAIGHGGVVMCCAGPMLLACIGDSLWQLVLEMSIFACQKPVLL